MAYVDRQSGTSRATSLATVAVIHAGFGAVLLYGLATNVIIGPDDEPLETTEFPLPQPTTPPTEEVIEQATKPDSAVTMVDPIIDVFPPKPDPFPTQEPVENTRPYVAPTPQPTWTPAIDPPKPFPVKRPRPSNATSSWVTTTDYPARDLRPGHEGTVRYRVIVGTNGRVQSCEITSSSGWPGLDEATCEKVSRRARFEPGSNDQGVKVVDSYSGTVTWQIPKD